MRLTPQSLLSYREAGLPALRGHFWTNFAAYYSISHEWSGSLSHDCFIGAFDGDFNEISYEVATPYGKHDGWFQGIVSFNSNRCSEIYRDDCTTVHPSAATVNYFVKAR